MARFGCFCLVCSGVWLLLWPARLRKLLPPPSTAKSSRCPIWIFVSAFGRSWLGCFGCGLFYGWLLLREPLPPSTEKNSLDYLSRLILLFLAFQCSAYVAILIFGRRYSWLGLWLAGARFEPLRFCLHLSISAWL